MPQNVIYDTGDPGDIVGTPPPVTPMPGGGGGGGGGGNAGGGTHAAAKPHPVQPKHAASHSQPRLSGWSSKDEDHGATYRAPTKAEGNRLLLDHSRVKGVPGVYVRPGLRPGVYVKPAWYWGMPARQIRVVEPLSRSDARDLLNPTVRSVIKDQILAKVQGEVVKAVEDLARLPEPLKTAIDALGTATDFANQAAAFNYDAKYGLKHGLKLIEKGVPFYTADTYTVPLSPTGLQIAAIEARVLSPPR